MDVLAVGIVSGREYLSRVSYNQWINETLSLWEFNDNIKQIDISPALF